MPTPSKTFTVRTEAQWNAMNSTVRMEMLVFLIMAGPCSVRELALLMDRPADGLYHHLRKLLKVGLLLRAGSRKVGTQTESMYRPVAPDIAVDTNLQSKRVRQHIRKLFRTIMQHAQRTLEAAIESRVAVIDGPEENFRLKWQATWLDDRQLNKVMRLQNQIFDIIYAGRQRQKGRQFAVLTYLSPVVQTRRTFDSPKQESE